MSSPNPPIERPRPERRTLRRLLPLVLLVTLTLPHFATAQSASSAAARGAQFVFVIDDSGSMRGHGGEAAADPDRLAVFSVQAVLSMLDPQDEVTVIRLNGPRDGVSPPPIEPLIDNRATLDHLLRLDGELAAYDGDYTPCRSALEATKQLLQRAYRPNVAQVVMFLTDGRCTPADELPGVESFLQGLESHQVGQLRFYLLRFSGRSFSNELARIAGATGGQVIEVDGEDPTDFLEPFADALTRSQGYEAELLTPVARELIAHRGARRVRLLSVAPGEGPRLDFRIADPRGRSPDLLGQTRHGIHKYPDGRVYRYAAVDYRPTTSPMTVEVDNGGSRWKVVAVPEYRLAVDLEVRRGFCADPGAELRHGTESGTPVCAVMRLVNERGQAVEREGMGRLEAYVLHGPDAEHLSKLPATPRGDTAVYTFERQRLDPGDHVFQPLVELYLPGRDEPVKMQGPPLGLEASTLRIQPRPASLDFGTLRPGEESAPRPVAFEGNFRPTPGSLEVADRRGLPSCITFTLSGLREAQTISAGTEMKIVAWVAPYCGPENLQRDFTPILRLAFDNDADGTYLPTAEIGATLRLDYRIERPAGLALSMRAGESGELPLRLGGNQVEPFDLLVMLESADERAGWPTGDLELGLVESGGGPPHDAEGSAEEATVTFSPASSAAPLRLRVGSGECCPGGSYETLVAFLPPGGPAYATPLPDPLVVPVRIEVEGAGFWACRGNAILWIVLLLLLLLLALYVALMFRNSTFLDRERLAEALTPLRWDGYGGTQRDSRSSAEVRAMVRRGMPLRERILAWLKANPLVFGLPGRAYRETVELSLQPQSVDRSSVWLVPVRDLQRRIEAEPDRGAGNLFAQALGRGGVEFFGVPLRGRLGRLVPERLQHQFTWDTDPDSDEQVPLKLLRLRRREQLLHPLPASDRTEGQTAGWQVG